MNRPYIDLSSFQLYGAGFLFASLCLCCNLNVQFILDRVPSLCTMHCRHKHYYLEAVPNIFCNVFLPPSKLFHMVFLCTQPQESNAQTWGCSFSAPLFTLLLCDFRRLTVFLIRRSLQVASLQAPAQLLLIHPHHQASLGVELVSTLTFGPWGVSQSLVESFPAP